MIEEWNFIQIIIFMFLCLFSLFGIIGTLVEGLNEH